MIEVWFTLAFTVLRWQGVFLHKFVSNAYSHISSISSLGRCIGVSINQSIVTHIKTYTYNYTQAFQYDNFVAMGAGERGGGGSGVKEMPGTIKWSPYSINPRYL